MKLIVVHAFDDYRRGDVISEPQAVSAALKEHRAAVSPVTGEKLPEAKTAASPPRIDPPKEASPAAS